MEQYKERTSTMKKGFAIVALLACLGLSACGSSEPAVVENPLCTPEEAASIGQNTVDNMDFIVRGDMMDQYAGDEVSYAGLVSWKAALEEMGSYTGVEDIKSEIGSDEVRIEILAGGTEHDAIVEMVLTNEGAQSISANIQYSMAELMERAALNTLIGMGTVFVVLIIISLLISGFNLIPKIQAVFKKDKTSGEKSIAEEAVDKTIAQIIKQEDDDQELVAVISAAIAAYEASTGTGSGGTDGFVVRSIRKRA